MPTYCANLTWLFTELPMRERVAAAARAGFEAVEVLWPYDIPADELAMLLVEAQIPLALINCPPQSDNAADQGYAAIPGREAQFKRDFTIAADYARTTGARFVHIMSGNAEGPTALETFIENLRWATQEATDLSLTIEPISPQTMPGYFLNDFDLAQQVISVVDAPNLHLQFDAYHAALITGDVMATWERLKDAIVHVQVAQVPARDEPVAGAIDYPAFFARLDAEGYEGWVSGEYKPRGSTQDGLGWIA